MEIKSKQGEEGGSKSFVSFSSPTGRSGLRRANVAPLLPTPSSKSSCQQLEISHGGNIYTTELKNATSNAFLPESTTAPQDTVSTHSLLYVYIFTLW